MIAKVTRVVHESWYCGYRSTPRVNMFQISETAYMEAIKLHLQLCFLFIKMFHKPSLIIIVFVLVKWTAKYKLNL